MKCINLSKEGDSQVKIAVGILGFEQLNSVVDDYRINDVFNGFYVKPNGETNQVFKHLINKYPYKQAIQMQSALHKDNFVDAYGNWLHTSNVSFETNEYNEPLIKEDATSFYVETIDGKYSVWNKDSIDMLGFSVKKTTETTNYPKYKKTPRKLKVSEAEIADISDRMTSLFERNGLKVSVVADTSLNGSATVVKDGSKVTVIYNPQRVRRDSIFHEFGHIYSELSNDKAFIQLGVEQLRGSELWNELAELYPDYSEQELGMEVLTTKIGQEAIEMNDSKFRFWLNRLFDRIAKVFGITPNVARTLAMDMIKGDLQQVIDVNSKMAQQWQRDEIQLQSLNIVTNFINQVRSPLQRYMQNEGKYLIGDSFTKKTKTLQTELRKYQYDENHEILERYNMVTSITEHDISWIPEIEAELNDLYKDYIYSSRSLNKLPYSELLEFAKRLQSVKRQLDTFIHIRDLEEFSAEELERSLDTVTTDNVTRYTPKELNSFDEADEQFVDLINKLANIRNGLGPRVTALDKRFDTVLRHFGIATIASSLNPDEIRHAADIYDKEMTDETKGQLIFMNNFDSTNVLVAASERPRRISQIAHEFMNNKLQIEFKAFVKEVGGLDKELVKSLYMNDEGDEIYRLVGEYDRERFNNAKSELMANQSWADDILNAIEDTITVSTPAEGKDGWKAEVERRKPKDKKDTKANTEFIIWFHDNFALNPVTDEYEPKLYGEFKKPTDIFLSAKYKSIHKLDSNGNKSKAGKIYDYLLKTQQLLTDHTVGSKEHKGQMPIIDTGNDTSIVDITKALVHGTQVAPTVEQRNEDGNLIRTLRFTNVADAITKPEYYIPPKDLYMTSEAYEKHILEYINTRHNTAFESITEVYEANAEIKLQNEEKLKASISYDLETVFPLYIKSSVDHKYKSEVEAHYHSTRAALGGTTIVKKSAKGLSLLNTASITPKGEAETTRIKGIDSNVYKRFDKDMDMKLYDNFLRYSKFNDAVLWGRNAVALLGIGFNPFSAAKNLGMGHTQAFAESRSGVQYSTNDLKKASSEYISNLTNITSDNISFTDAKKQDYATSDVSAVMKLFNIVDDYNDIIDRVNNLDVIKESTTEFQKTKQKAERIVNNAAYLMTVNAEHNMHNETLLAMLNSHRVIDGEIVSRYNYSTDFRELTDEEKNDRTKLKQYVKERKEHIASKEKEFETVGIKLRDAFEVTGQFEKHAAIKKDEEGNDIITLEQYSNFKLKVQGVNHKLHGIYNREDKGIIENFILGQAAMQFHHWLPAAWARRFGAAGIPFRTETVWNERRQEFEIGDYNAISKLFMIPINHKRVTIKHDKGQINMAEYITTFIQGAFDFITHSQLYYHTMTPAEQASVRRGTAELTTALLIMITTGLLAKAPPDDDDNKAYVFGYNFTMYTLGGVKDELLGLTPIYGWFAEGAKLKENPTATFSYTMDLIRMFLDVSKYPFRTPEQRVYRSGANKGKGKIATRAQKFIPFWNNTFRRFIKMSTPGTYKNYSMWSW